MISETSLPPGRYYQQRPFHRTVLIQTAFCVLPPTAFLLAGNLTLAGIAMVATLLPLLAIHATMRNPLMFSSILVGTLPMYMELRGLVNGTYNLPQLLAMAGVLLWMALRRPEAQILLKRPFSVVLMAATTAYWLGSFAATGDYAANMRALELAFWALNFFLLGRHRAYFASAMLSLAFSNACFGIAALPHGERLGMFELDGVLVGNPQAFGGFATLILAATFADGGRWMSLIRENPWLGWAIRVFAGACVLLSTSRSAWGVSAIAVAMIYLYDNRRRLEVMASIAALTVAGVALIASGIGGTFEEYLGRTFNTEQSLAKLTTGRSEQWAAMPTVIAASPVWGFGPGRGRQVSREYAHLNIVWHSLYLQIAAELGLSGVAITMLLIAALISRAYRYLCMTGEVLPLVGAVGFLLIGFVVPGLDGATAAFLGTALIAFDTSRWHVLRTAPAAPETAHIPLTAEQRWTA